MFKLLKKRPKGETITLQLSGLHCTSCSLNIDGELEDVKGVLKAKTSYAKQQSVVEYDPRLVKSSTFTKVIENLGYKVISS